jgi:ubiquinone biosynthesis protein
MSALKDEISNLKRLDEIVRTTAEHGFYAFLSELNLSHRLPLLERLGFSGKQESQPERLRGMLESLGPTFIKFGQLMGQRPDIVPANYRDELKKLQDDIGGFPASEARDIVEKEVGPVEENFSEFEDDPVGCASIAQVHGAELETGEEVVVKIRRPGIKEKVDRDLDILKSLAKRGERVSSRISELKALEMVKEFEDWITDELDLEKEARNAEVLRNNMSGDEGIKIPEIHQEVSTERVMVMERVEGLKATETEKLKEIDIDAEAVADRGISMGLKQVIRDGFFHADPHPSNFFIDTETGQIILIDFGMVGKLTETTRRKLGLLFLHVANEDVDSAVQTIQEIGSVREDADIPGLRKDVEEMILLLKNSRAKDSTVTRTALDMIVSASRRGIDFPSSLVLTGKAMVTIEGIVLSINPDADLTHRYSSEVKEILREQNSPKDLATDLAIDMIQNRDLITKAPSKLNQALETDDEGRDVHVHDEGREGRAIMAAGLSVSAAILLQGELGLQASTVLGVLLFMAAGVLILRD